MFKTRSSVPGSSPATLIPHLVDGKVVPPKITLIEYDRTTLEERAITDIREITPHLDNNKVTWINIDGLGDVETIKTLGEMFQLHPLALEDVFNTGQRPKTEVFADYLFIIAQMVFVDGEAASAASRSACFLAGIS